MYGGPSPIPFRWYLCECERESRPSPSPVFFVLLRLRSPVDDLQSDVLFICCLGIATVSRSPTSIYVYLSVRLPPLASFACGDRESTAVDIAFVPLQNLPGSHVVGAHGLLLSHTGLPILVPLLLKDVAAVFFHSVVLLEGVLAVVLHSALFPPRPWVFIRRYSFVLEADTVGCIDVQWGDKN
ncbi:hypothetical protein Taro_028698 [Colocasia esculenta]|uniref:Uncharacterized protein n=1 Tax=Colocasia esculenta TaxID=4460 RepID=A0A843VUY0_COLES|nr:hypothetical protein [Colocasia esculenta]